MNTTAHAADHRSSRLLQHHARDIANALLSRTGSALMRGDFEAFSACFHLPSTVETFEGKNVLSTLDDMKQVFVGVRRHLIRKSVSEMIRNVLSADFEAEDVVKSTHETRLMNGTRLVQEPYPCLSEIRRFGNDWKIVSSSYAIVNEPRHTDILLGHAKQDARA